jgi:hypothetical protein
LLTEAWLCSSWLYKFAKEIYMTRRKLNFIFGF